MTISGLAARPRTLLTKLLGAGLRAVDPVQAVRRAVRRRGPWLHVGGIRYDLRRYRSVVVVGAGKASAPMARELETVLGPRLSGGLVVVKYGHGARTRRVRVVEAGHPVPDRAGLQGATRLLDLVARLTSDDLLLVVLSGGASSLLPAPCPGVSLADKRRTTTLLLRSGATIQEINAVRKHLSAVKGGQLIAATRATVASLILSDVIGDDLASIGSGPTAPDPTTFRDARAVLDRFHLWRKLPAHVRTHLTKGLRKQVPDTPKPGARVFKRVRNHIIGNNRAAVAAVAAAAESAGLRTLVLTTSLTGEARDAAKFLAALAREARVSGQPVRPPACLVAGGELTVTIRGQGRGGRAQEFALAAGIEMAGLKDAVIAALGTDGTDGPTDAAGAAVSGETMSRAGRLGLNLQRALADNDAYPVFRRLGGHIVTGPTRTNVNDLYVALLL